MNEREELFCERLLADGWLDPNRANALKVTLASSAAELTRIQQAADARNAALEGECAGLRADAERLRWLIDNNARVVECCVERIGYRSTAHDAPRERWDEFTGWTVSTLRTDQEFSTMREAIDAARTSPARTAGEDAGAQGDKS